MFAGIAEAQLFSELPHLCLELVPERELRVGQLLLSQHIEYIALVLAGVKRLFQKIPAGFAVIFDAGVMAGHNIVQTLFPRELEQLVKFHIPVAVDTGVGRTAHLIGPDEFTDDLLFEIHGEVQYFIRDVQLKGHLAGVVNVPLRAAGVKLAQSNIFR